VFLIQIFLPLYDNRGERLDHGLFTHVQQELTERFGGLTSYSRAPVKGLWKEDDDHTTRDDLVIVEVMAEELDRSWWQAYREELERRFRQEQMVVRSQPLELL
jgi:hypothetical protein